MKIICNNQLAVKHNGIWKQRKKNNFAVSSPWENPTEWRKDSDPPDDEDMEVGHEKPSVYPLLAQYLYG